MSATQPSAHVSTTTNTTALVILLTGLLLSIVATTTLSAYIRLAESGLDCEPWPACHGVVSEYLVRDANRAALAQALTPHSAEKKVHRLIVTTMVVLLGVLVFGYRRHPALGAFERRVPYVLVFVTTLLAVVGPASYLKTYPAIAVVNLLGGLALLGLTWRVLLAVAGTERIPVDVRARQLAAKAVLSLSAQIALGVWVSANFAGPVCSGVFDCHASAVTGDVSVTAFWPLRELTLDQFGRVMTDNNAWIIHLVHRLSALLTAALLVYLAVLLLRADPRLRSDAYTLLLLVVSQVVLGFVQATQRFPLNTVLLHSVTAAVLLMAVVRVKYRCTARVAPDVS